MRNDAGCSGGNGRPVLGLFAEVAFWVRLLGNLLYSQQTLAVVRGGAEPAAQIPLGQSESAVIHRRC